MEECVWHNALWNWALGCFIYHSVSQRLTDNFVTTGHPLLLTTLDSNSLCSQPQVFWFTPDWSVECMGPWFRKKKSAPEAWTFQYLKLGLLIVQTPKDLFHFGHKKQTFHPHREVLLFLMFYLVKPADPQTSLVFPFILLYTQILHRYMLSMLKHTHTQTHLYGYDRFTCIYLHMSIRIYTQRDKGVSVE